MFAVLNIADKVILTDLGLRVRSFLLFIGLQTLLAAVVISIVNPFPSADAGVYVRGLAVGVMWGIGAPLVMQALSREEVSRVAPISQSYPLLVVILAVVFLGESLTLLESVAAALAIGGALLAAVRRSAGGGLQMSRVLGYLVVAVVIVAVAQVLLKTVTDDLSFWHAFGLRGAGMAAVLIPMNLRPAFARDLARCATSPKLLVALAVDAGAATIALVLVTFAIATGPVSLVSAVAGTTPLLVFVLSALLAWKTALLVDETLEARVIAQKLVAAGMVVSGLMLIALT
jgi:drug/metabolite transporter (DMT)-like permease